VSLRVLAPGLLTTIQDLGRTGSRHLGVGRAGALDAYSHAIANLLVGNPVGSATLEVNLAGPTLACTRAAVIAVCGADIDAQVDGHALPGWRPVRVPAGATVSLGPCRQGARAYLSVAGGFSAVPVLGSASTDLRGGFGGVHGRALRRGDTLAFPPLQVAIDAVQVARWWIDPSPELQWDVPAVVRVLPPSDDTPSPRALFAAPWHIASAGNRQGLRLEGGLLAPADATERISEPVAPGTIQLPPDGRPIVLLADAQTHGGYPRIGHVIRADWPRLGQLRPGESLRFRPCTHDEARLARLDQSRRLARIALAISACSMGARAGR
jgi:antagonist of KipI